MKKLNYALHLFIAGIIAFSGMSFADQSVIGQIEFQKSCAACHGMDGKGNGPFLDFLKQAPSDLTLIASRNNGKFPFQKIYQTIEDPAGNRAHGNQDMPVWGEQFSREEIKQYGLYDTQHPGLVEARILKLVFYLATIQK
jgi:mono/diheme cytochrome c family protein